MWRILLILLIPFLTCGQEPAHNIIGSDEFEDAVVYSMIQDDRANIWITTNNGLYRYDGYEFHDIPVKKVVNKALFGLTTDSKDNIYCYNTSGQVLKLNNDSLELFYKIPDTLFRNFYYIGFDNLDNLIISGTSIYSVAGNQVKTILKQTSFHEFPIVKKSDGSLEFYSSYQNDIYRYKDGKISPQNMTIDFGKYGFYYPIEANNQDYIGVGRSSHIYKRTGNKYQKIETNFNQEFGCWIFVDSQDDIWTLSNQRGVYFHTQDQSRSRFSNKLLFPSYTFSCNLEDRDGNIWLGTFGKGIIQISNKENQLISNEQLPGNNVLKCIDKDVNGKILIGSVNGEILEYKNDKLELVETTLSRIDKIKYNCLTDKFYFNYLELGKDRQEIDQTSYGSVRKITTTDDSISITTAYTGIFIKDHSKSESNKSNFEKLGLDASDNSEYKINVSRSLCANYDSKTNTVWIGSSSKLRQITIEGETEFKYNNEYVIALDMLWVSDTLYISTISNGILKIHNNSVVGRISEKDGLIAGGVFKMQQEGNKLYFGIKHGIQEYNLDNGAFRTFKNANGRQLKVKDFTILGDKIYVVHIKGLQTISLNSKKIATHPPVLDFSSILVNKTERIQETNPSLDHTQNNLLFKFAAKTYKNREQLVYKYQILGISSKWETLPYNENYLRLSGLDYGDYALTVYAIDGNNQKSNVIHYAFSIPQPFWMAWWFYLSLALITIGSIVLFYKRRLKIQQAKADQINELNASKLTAIQSQMNPHFIFNSLNSIQDLVIQGDKENSYRFITKFANLVRKTLKYSDKDFVEFDQEVQLLEIYLSLEKLRFKTDFEYSIETNEISDILIPPMLIQPFIENALIHGLLHKEGIKKLDLNFHLDNHLTCTITDNGIGRTKAKEIKERQQSNHESFAVQAIKKRLIILEEKFDSSIGFEYFDLYENDAPSGTKVIIKMPIERLY